VDQDQWILEHRFHSLWICHEVWTEITAIKLHSFDNFEGCVHRLGLFNRNDPIFANFVHRFRDNVADGCIAIC
jgi:hypothetical protein